MFTQLFTVYFALAAVLGPFLCCCAVKSGVQAVSSVAVASDDHHHCGHSSDAHSCHGHYGDDSQDENPDPESPRCPCDHDAEPFVFASQQQANIAGVASGGDLSFPLPAALVSDSADTFLAVTRLALEAHPASLRTGRDILRAYCVLRC